MPPSALGVLMPAARALFQHGAALASFLLARCGVCLAKFDQKQVVYLSFGSKFEVDGPNPSHSELLSPLCKCKFFSSRFSLLCRLQRATGGWTTMAASGDFPPATKAGIGSSSRFLPKTDLGVMVKSVKCDNVWR